MSGHNSTYRDNLFVVFYNIREKYKQRLGETLRTLEKHCMMMLEEALTDAETRLLNCSLSEQQTLPVTDGTSIKIEDEGENDEDEESSEEGILLGNEPKTVKLDNMKKQPITSEVVREEKNINNGQEQEAEEDLDLSVPDYSDLNVCPDVIDDWFAGTSPTAPDQMKTEPMESSTPFTTFPTLMPVFPPLPHDMDNSPTLSSPTSSRARLPPPSMLLDQHQSQPPPLQPQMIQQTQQVAQQPTHLPLQSPQTSTKQDGHTSVKQDSHQGQHQWHACPDCGRRFRQHPKLRMHIASQHSGRNPYQCSICQRAFSRNDSLLRHLRTMHRMLTHELLTRTLTEVSKPSLLAPTT